MKTQLLSPEVQKLFEALGLVPVMIINDAGEKYVGILYSFAIEWLFEKHGIDFKTIPFHGRWGGAIMDFRFKESSHTEVFTERYDCVMQGLKQCVELIAKAA